MREERQLGGAAQPAGLAIHHLSQTLLIRVPVSKTTLTIIKHSMSATGSFSKKAFDVFAQGIKP